MMAVQTQSNDQVRVDDWHGLYREKWAGLIHPDAIAHPAKFARALIRQIYQHAIDEGWLVAGDSVLDCFGGVALGAHDALRHGLHWQGVELEPRFVDLGGKNIELWNERFAGKLPRWGTARLIEGDSRRLVSVIAEAQGLIGSPPFSDPKSQIIGQHQGVRSDYNARGIEPEHVFADPANLGNLRATDSDLAAVIASPPFVESLATNPPNIEYQKERQRRRGRNPESAGAGVVADYGNANGQVGAMREGDLAAVITSPPFVESLASDDPEKRGGLFKDAKRANDKTLTATYGTSDGQLGAMKEGARALVSSPPYEGSVNNSNDPERNIKKAETLGYTRESMGNPGGQLRYKFQYSEAQNNLGNSTGETFWSASRLILEQCHQVLAPGAHAIFVVKDFVRKGQVVPFCEQWAQLCEAVGFRLLHIHRSWLIEPKGAQHRLDGGEDDLSIQRKSFFRLLAERKGSPRIDFETVLCFEKAQ